MFESKVRPSLVLDLLYKKVGVDLLLDLNENS